MLGACYLTEWTAGLEHMYELGKEIETYRTPEELTASSGNCAWIPRAAAPCGSERSAGLFPITVSREALRALARTLGSEPAHETRVTL